MSRVLVERPFSSIARLLAFDSTDACRFSVVMANPFASGGSVLLNSLMP
jgi:hypothetical protein